MVERNRDDGSDTSSATSPLGQGDGDEIDGSDANRSGLTREPVPVADDRGRDRDAARTDFSRDREADELGGEITRPPDGSER